MEIIFNKVSVLQNDLRYGRVSVIRTPFYGCFQTLTINAFLWMITLFGANTPEPSKICSKVEDFFVLSTGKLYVFSEMYSSQKNPWNLKGSL